jgi:hypothetical protein
MWGWTGRYPNAGPLAAARESVLTSSGDLELILHVGEVGARQLREEVPRDAVLRANLPEPLDGVATSAGRSGYDCSGRGGASTTPTGMASLIAISSPKTSFSHVGLLPRSLPRVPENCGLRSL